MLVFVMVLLATVVAAGIGVSIKRRGNSGDRDYHGPAMTGYEGGGATRSMGDTGGI